LGIGNWRRRGGVKGGTKILGDNGRAKVQSKDEEK
jgi:hypothetical protein